MSILNVETKQLGVWIVEDHTDFRNILKEAINDSETLKCEQSFSNVEDVLFYLASRLVYPPDIIVLDLVLPGMSGIKAIPKIKEFVPQTKIIVLTMHSNKVRVYQALGAGAEGYLIKSSGINSIVQGISDVYNGIAPLSSEIAQMVFSTFSKFKPDSKGAQLTEREIEVLQHLSTGASRHDTSVHLQISRNTLDAHIRNIYRKLQVHNLSGALNKAISSNLV